MSGKSSDEVREGFLCPICVQDLGTFHKLQNHFETAHTAEDKAILGQIKGLFSRARGKLLGNNEEDESHSHVDNAALRVSSQDNGNTSFHQAVWEPQEFGCSRSHLESFKNLRDARIDRFVIESNKILIRLEKLLQHSRMMRWSNRKEYERSLVFWVRDGDVPFCPSCGERFSLRRRRHHCRLCGSIMCSHCSKFISYHLADELVRTLQRATSSRSTVHPRRRSLTTPQQQQLAGDSPPVQQVRCCTQCDKILCTRKERKDLEQSQSMISLLYDKMRLSVEQANKLSPEYNDMADSLNQGEEDYQLDGAQELRMMLVKQYELVDVMSKKIACLNVNDEDEPPSRLELRLQSAVRRSAHAYLQENMLRMRALPSLPKLEILQKEKRKLKEKRRRQQQEEMERERIETKRLLDVERLKLERETEKKERLVETRGRQNDKLPFSSRETVILGGGFIGASSASLQGSSPDSSDHEEDPLQEQIVNVERMLRQAEDSRMHEEARSLRNNLFELRQEHKRLHLVRAFGTKPTRNGNGANSFNIPSHNALHPHDVKQHNSGRTKEQPVIKPKENCNSFMSPVHQPVARGNPFLDDNPKQTPQPYLAQNKNPFLEHSETHRRPSNANTNSFLSCDNGEAKGNPFVVGGRSELVKEKNPFVEEEEVVFSPISRSEDVGGDPMMQQIAYISQCLDEAVKFGKHDEARMLRDNLRELQHILNSSFSGCA